MWMVILFTPQRLVQMEQYLPVQLLNVLTERTASVNIIQVLARIMVVYQPGSNMRMIRENLWSFIVSFNTKNRPLLGSMMRIFLVALTGASLNFRTHVSRLSAGLPAVLRRRLQVHPVKQRQVQRRLTAKQAAQLAAEYEAGASMQQLADRWNLHRTTVADQLRRAGVAIRQRGIPPERLDEAIRLYGEGWSCQRLAERFDCDDETVRQTLKRAGVKLRKP